MEPVRKRQFPLVGGGAGHSSWVHLDDAASATVLAVEQHVRGVFNIVDDEPAPASDWLPYLAECAGAKRPVRVPAWLARPLGGGKAPLWGKGVVGAENVAGVLASILAPFARIGGVVEPHELNGQPGAIFRDREGKVINTWTLDILDGRIQTIRAVINPDKLGHLGPVADAWAVVREANQARLATGEG